MTGNLNVNKMEEWGLEEFSFFLEGSKKTFGQKDSASYRGIKETLFTFITQQKQLQDKEVDLESSIKMVNLRDKLLKECLTYENENKHNFSITDRNRMKAIQQLVQYCEEKQNFDSLRDQKALNSYEGKKWSQLDFTQDSTITTIQMDQLTDKVGEKGSDRFLVEHQTNGAKKKGFFTAKQKVVDRNSYIQEQIKNEPNKKHKAVMNAFMKNHEAASYFNEIQNTTEMEPDDLRELALYESLEQIEDTEVKNTLQNIMRNNYHALSSVITEYKKDKRASFSECLPEDLVLSEQLSECREWICQYADAEPDFKSLTGKEAVSKKFDLLIYQNIDGVREPLKTSFLKNQEAKEHFLEMVDRGNKLSLATDKNLAVGDELSNRNIATSRMAELFGVENLIARSEKMIVKTGEQTLQGCFMEFAKGVDVQHGDPKALAKINKIPLDKKVIKRDVGDDNIKNEFPPSAYTSGFTKDLCNLEVFDCICDQRDRHAGNVFLQLKEGKDGNQITGIQGIDNDMAFTGSEKPSAIKLYSMSFISAEMAQKILSIKTDDLKDILNYKVGDLLPDKNIEALGKRIEAVQKHIKENMIQLQDGDWDLINRVKQLEENETLSEKEQEHLDAIFAANTNEGRDLEKTKECFNKDIKKLKENVGLNKDIADKVDSAKERFRERADKWKAKPAMEEAVQNDAQKKPDTKDKIQIGAQRQKWVPSNSQKKPAVNDRVQMGAQRMPDAKNTVQVDAQKPDAKTWIPSANQKKPAVNDRVQMGAQRMPDAKNTVQMDAQKPDAKTWVSSDSQKKPAVNDRVQMGAHRVKMNMNDLMKEEPNRTKTRMPQKWVPAQKASEKKITERSKTQNEPMRSR